MIRVYPGGIVEVNGERHLVDSYLPKSNIGGGYVVTDEGIIFWDNQFEVILKNNPRETFKSIPGESLKEENVRRYEEVTDRLKHGSDKVTLTSRLKISKILPGTTSYVHNFLEHGDELLTYKTNEKGVRTFKVTSKLVSSVFINDYILKWAENGCNKVIYRIQHTVTGQGMGACGRLVDLVATKAAGPIAKRAILLMDKDATLKSLDVPTEMYRIGMGER
jgi:hypothetical protein